jgi:hypothetical protein
MRNPHTVESITIPREQYFSLKRSEAMLQALEAGGVDNWDWHSEAYRDYMKSIKGEPWDNGEGDE